MILDLARFVEKERPHWEELEQALDQVQGGLLNLGDLKQSRRVLALFQRACSDLSRIGAANAEPELRAYLESLVARGYAEIHSAQGRVNRFRPLHWFMRVFPSTFRRQLWAMWASLAISGIGALVGALLVTLDSDAMAALSPFPHTVEQTPSQRVAREESDYELMNPELEKQQGRFSAHLMANNIGVSINVLALGLTYGVGSVLLLFYNGVVLGGVAADYLYDGQGVFLCAWLLPHGSFELTAIFIAGQAALVLARAMIGWGTREGLRSRMREVVPDLATLIGGVAIMLVWAGLVESFLSQYHAPVIPYSYKIAFGLVELVVVVSFLGLCGKQWQLKQKGKSGLQGGASPSA
jgi:uncharacterized membrane protein SpoIIM required for sporulation